MRPARRLPPRRSRRRGRAGRAARARAPRLRRGGNLVERQSRPKAHGGEVTGNGSDAAAGRDQPPGHGAAEPLLGDERPEHVERCNREVREREVRNTGPDPASRSQLAPAGVQLPQHARARSHPRSRALQRRERDPRRQTSPRREQRRPRGSGRRRGGRRAPDHHQRDAGRKAEERVRPPHVRAGDGLGDERHRRPGEKKASAAP